MSLLSDLQSIFASLDLPLETGVFTGEAPEQYIVAVPLSDSFDLHADNRPGVDIQEVRLSLYCKGSYTAWKNKVVKALLTAGLTVTARQYIGFETETGYHHYNMDVAHYYEMEE